MRGRISWALLLFLALWGPPARADLSNSTVNAWLNDSSGNGLTSQVSGSQRALDIGINVSGVQVDPRTRTWTLSGGSDTVTANQGTAAALGSAWPFKLTDGTNLMPTADVAGRALFSKITDGTNTLGVTSNSAAKVEGVGTAGTPTGGVVSIQGVAGGKAVPITAPGVSTATITSVANAVTSSSVLASNANRQGVMIYNDSSTTCNIAFATTASNTAFSFQMAKGSTYFMVPPIYTGAISSICASASGNLRVTEE